MSDIRRQLYNACDPSTPAEDKYYTDLSEVRGGDTFVHTFCEELNQSNERVLALFTGHSGCGKSSELKKLQHELSCDIPKHAHRRYFPVYVDAADHVDYFDTSLTEVLLSIVTEMAAQFRGIGIELKNSVLANLLSDIVGIVRGTKPTKATLDLKLIKLDLALNRADPSSREQVRNSLVPRTTGLLEEINNLFVQARTSLREAVGQNGKRQYDDFLLILDNLEKIERIAGEEQGEASYRALFIKGAPQFTRLNCHTLFTVHLSLARAEGQELMTLYGNEPVVLSNVKVEKRGTHEPWQQGREALRQLLLERCRPYELAQCIDTDALDFILKYSGGHVRQFLNFVRESTLYTDTTPIPLDAAKRAVYKAVPSYSTGSRAKWELLAELETSEEQDWDTDDEAKRDLMRKLFVLEYLNGDYSRDELEQVKPWYAVHPIARELDEFKKAVAARRKVQA